MICTLAGVAHRKENKNWWLRLHEKGGKYHEMPVHHALEEYLDAYRLPGWEGVVLRLVSYQLPDGKLIRVLTDRFDLSTLSIAQLYKERWTIENW